eukprot:5354229-Amphidinium_carterae.1
MEGVQPRPQPAAETNPATVRQQEAKQQRNPAKQASTKPVANAEPAVATTGRAPESSGQQTTNVELVYH